MSRRSKRLWSVAAATAAASVTSSSSPAFVVTKDGVTPPSPPSCGAMRKRRSLRIPTTTTNKAAASEKPEQECSQHSRIDVSSFSLANAGPTSSVTTTPQRRSKTPPAARQPVDAPVLVSPHFCSTAPQVLVSPDPSPAAVRTPNTTPRIKSVVASHSNSKVRSVPRTHSFGAAIQTSSSGVLPHTLILGTHPSIQSLERQQYYGHPMNAFWWIAGDCLGFRRDTALSPVTQQPYRFSNELRYPIPAILPYDQQLATLLQAGFGLWDVVASCERPGSSLDQDIRAAQPNDIYGFCQMYPSIRRIVLANGGSGSKEFVRHFTDWLSSGQLVVPKEEDGSSAKALGPVLKRRQRTKTSKVMAWTSPHTITLVAALSVSPAAARYSYAEKRDFWERYVYQPGLEILGPEPPQQRQDNNAPTACTSRYFVPSTEN